MRGFTVQFYNHLSFSFHFILIHLNRVKLSTVYTQIALQAALYKEKDKPLKIYNIQDTMI